MLAALVLAAPAEAKTFTLTLPDAPTLTFTVPAGWKARERGRFFELTRGDRRLAGFECRLSRSQRDMTGRNMIPRDYRRLAPGVYGDRNNAAIAVPGGGCLLLGGRGAAAVAARMHPVLGPGGPTPVSNAEAERLAREARKRTLGRAYAEGTAVAVPVEGGFRIESAFEWSLPTGYVHQVQHFVSAEGRFRVESLQLPGDDMLFEEQPCWQEGTEGEDDDTFEPRLELSEWNAPPSTKTAWRVAYAPPEALPDGTTLVRWTGFVADGEAVIGPDGLLRRVRIEDHQEADGRTAFRTVDVAFTGFPAAITPVRPEPLCG